MEFLRLANVELRNPFEVTELPLLATAYKLGYQRYRKRSLATILFKRSFRAFYKLLRAAGTRGRGRALYLRDGRTCPLAFSARNTQFQSLFMPQYAGGYEPETLALCPSGGMLRVLSSAWGSRTLLLEPGNPLFSVRDLALAVGGR